MAKILELLDKKIVERVNENRMILLGILSGEHTLILGPPGTAKSLAARTFCELIEGGIYFDYLLTRFTTPDEIFGPISVKKLEEDIYTRNTESYLPTAHIAFLDEIFKASSAILNTLLTIINERKFHNGNKFDNVPLISLIAASNELPSENEESLQALYDRFVIRLIVNYVQNEDHFKKIIVNNCFESEIKEKITLDEVKELQTKSKLVKIPELIWDVIISIKNKLKENNIIISDRRWQKIISILRMSAISNGRDEIDESDILLLKFLLINDFKQMNLITHIVKNALTEGDTSSEDIYNDIKDIRDKKNTTFYLYQNDDLIEKKTIKTGIRYKYTASELKAIKKLLLDDLKEIEKGLKDLNQRRNNLEDRTKENIWIKWIEITDLIEPIDHEISNLNKLKDKLNEILEEIKKADSSETPPISIKFDCPYCEEKDGIVLDNIDLKEKKFEVEVECPYCGRYCEITNY
ncbi:MAG: AAA family ATPase [Candidatus Helarchaeota archaeon]